MFTIKNPPEGGKTNIPMSSAELPQQRLYEVKSLPQRPAVLAVTSMDYESQHGLPGIPKKPTKKSISLAQVEWAWSPLMAMSCIRVKRIGCFGVAGRMIMIVTTSATGMPWPVCR